jgi:glycerophosphoryl diester phosphodiesterase
MRTRWRLRAGSGKLDMTSAVLVEGAHRGQGGPALDRTAFVRPIAHRGLHDHVQGRLENTAPAFRAAIQKHYGIECDLQAAEDGTPMVFHDPRLDRLIDGSGPIAAFTPSKLRKLRYRGQKEKILTFAQFLELVHGRVPVLVEVKVNGTTGRATYLDKIARAARAYNGPIALMSFNRTIVSELAVRAPKVPRGCVVGGQQMLSTLWARRNKRRSGPIVPPRLFAPSRDGIGFYAVDVKLAAVARTWMTRNGLDLPLFAWTVRTPRQRATAARWADAPIFEGYEP